MWGINLTDFKTSWGKGVPITAKKSIQGKSTMKMKELRKQNDLTQEELSFKSGISRTSISRLENGHDLPSEQIQKQIERILGPITDWPSMPEDESQPEQGVDETPAVNININFRISVGW